jgi:transcriptional regulator with XRE-family HTH domain
MNQAVADVVRERHWICAQRLRERRRALKLTQLDVVTRLHDHGAEMTNRALSSMENGRGLDLGWLPELATALDCTVTYLLGLTDDPARWLPDGIAPPRQPQPNHTNGSTEVYCGILGPNLADVPARRARSSGNGG